MRELCSARASQRYANAAAAAAAAAAVATTEIQCHVRRVPAPAVYGAAPAHLRRDQRGERARGTVWPAACGSAALGAGTCRHSHHWPSAPPLAGSTCVGKASLRILRSARNGRRGRESKRLARLPRLQSKCNGRSRSRGRTDSVASQPASLQQADAQRGQQVRTRSLCLSVVCVCVCLLGRPLALISLARMRVPNYIVRLYGSPPLARPQVPLETP